MKMENYPKHDNWLIRSKEETPLNPVKVFPKFHWIGAEVSSKLAFPLFNGDLTWYRKTRHISVIMTLLQKNYFTHFCCCYGDNKYSLFTEFSIFNFQNVYPSTSFNDFETSTFDEP